MPVLNDGDESVENGPIDGDKTNADTSENDIAVSGRTNNDIAASERMGTRPIPTPLYDMIGTFNPITYIVTWAGITVVTTGIECFILWLIFGMPWKRRWVMVVLAANAITVLMAAVTALLY